MIGEGQNPFANLPIGGIAASVRYIDGVTGANVFMMPRGVRARARECDGRRPPRRGR